MKGINFHIEKNLARAFRDAKCASVCVSVCVYVCMSEGKNGITFDPLHEINRNFQGLLSKKVVLLGR